MDADVLTREHLDALNQCLRENGRCSELIRKAREAGLPVEELEQDCAAKCQLATRLKRLFFPSEP